MYFIKLRLQDRGYSLEHLAGGKGNKSINVDLANTALHLLKIHEHLPKQI